MRRLAAHHAIVPFPFRVQVSHQTREPPFEFLPALPGIQQGASRRRRGMSAHFRAWLQCIDIQAGQPVAFAIGAHGWLSGPAGSARGMGQP